MPNIKQQKKRLRKNREQTKKNKTLKSRLKTAKKNLLNSDTKEEAEKNLKEFYKIVDKVAQKGIIHKNKAARDKSKMSKFVDTFEE